MLTSPTIVKQRPTAVIGTVATIVLTVLAKLVAAGVISASFAKSWGPWITLVLVGLLFLLTWLHVSPAAKLEQLIADHQAQIESYSDQLDNGRLPEADLARLRGEFEDAAAGLLNVLHPKLADVAAADAHPTGDDHPDATAVGAPETDTMSAGAPPQPPLVTGTLAQTSPAATTEGA